MLGDGSVGSLLNGLVGVIVRVLVVLITGATGLLLARLAWTRLFRVYPWLTIYLAVDLILRVLRLNLEMYDSALYKGGETFKVPLLILVLWELCRMGFANHSALAAFARRISWHVIGISTVAACIAWFLDPAVPEGRSAGLHYFVGIERAITTGLFVFSAALGLFMMWFPVRMRRNVAIYLTGFVVYFGAEWVALTVINLAPGATNWANVLGCTVLLVALLYWAFTVNIEGESLISVTGIHWDRAQVERLSRQLDAINSSLVRYNQ